MPKNDLAKNSVIPMVGIVRVKSGVQGMNAIHHRVPYVALSVLCVISEKRCQQIWNEFVAHLRPGTTEQALKGWCHVRDVHIHGHRALDKAK
jgi:hypothetical protein